MKRTGILIATLFIAITAISQKPNPVIGKKEFEISLFYSDEVAKAPLSYQHLTGTQIVHRWSWKKYTKLGAGGVAAVIDYDPIGESDNVVYGALFGDITQFIGQRQKWCVSGQIGHGIFKRELKGENSNGKEVYKHTAGMYYSISFSYRSVISKKMLFVVSPAYTLRNFRQNVTRETYSPPSVVEYTLSHKYSGLGIRLGIVFLRKKTNLPLHPVLKNDHTTCGYFLFLEPRYFS